MAEHSFINYIQIPSALSPREADSLIAAAVKSGAKKIIILPEADAEPFSASSRQKLLSLFRSAYKRKALLYISDDFFPYSGTAFGNLSSVSSLWPREIKKICQNELKDGDVCLGELSDYLIVSRTAEPDENYPYKHYPNLTDPYAAELVIDFFYKRLISEYEKFVPYELRGFAAVKPSFMPPLGDILPYNEEAFSIINKKELSELFSNGPVRDKYLSAIQECFEKNYLLPLKSFCENHKLDFIFSGWEKGASNSFCQKESAFFLPESFPSSDLSNLSREALKKRDAILSVSPASPFDEEFSSLRKFLGSIPENTVRLTLSEGTAVLPEGDNFLLVNASEDKSSYNIVPPSGSWLITDPEEKAFYPFDSGRAYEFSPGGFLFISRGEALSIDELPVRVGAVRTSPQGEPLFELNVSSPVLPDAPLFGTQLEVEGSFECLKVQISSVNKTLLSAPFTVPLYEFCRGANVYLTPFNGDISRILVSKSF